MAGRLGRRAGTGTWASVDGGLLGFRREGNGKGIKVWDHIIDSPVSELHIR
jgi:hypothetical protein